MKKIGKLKLSELNKASMDPREMSRLYGGTYCAVGYDDYSSNKANGTCSCACANEAESYYGNGLANTSEREHYKRLYD